MAKTREPLGWRLGEGLAGVLHAAIEAVPPVKYALGVAGIIASVALVKGYFSSAAAALLAGAGMMVLMLVLLVFAAASRLAVRILQLPALVFTWAILSLFIIASCLLMFSVFFRWPAPFPELLKQLSSLEALPPSAGTPKPSDQLPGSGSHYERQSNVVTLLGTEWIVTFREIDGITARPEEGRLKIYAADATRRDILQGPESAANAGSGPATGCNQADNRQCGLADIHFDGHSWIGCRYSAEKSEALIDCPSNDVLPTNKLKLHVTAELLKGSWTIYCTTGDGIELWRVCPSSGVLLFDAEVSRRM